MQEMRHCIKSNGIPIKPNMKFLLSILILTSILTATQKRGNPNECAMYYRQDGNRWLQTDPFDADTIAVIVITGGNRLVAIHSSSCDLVVLRKAANFAIDVAEELQ